MKRIIQFVLFLCLAGPVMAQTPPAVGLYYLNGASWTPNPNASGTNPYPATPPPVGIYCSTDGKTWTPCTIGGGGGGVTSINSVTGAFTFTGSGVSCTSTTCTFSGGTGSGTVTTSGTPTTNAIPKFTGSTVIGNSTLTDNGTTVSTTEPMSVGSSLATTADGVHPSYFSMVGNTTNPTLTANTFGLLGPTTTTPTAFAWQVPSATNASAGLIHVAANSGGISALSVSQVGIGDLSATGTPSSTTFLRGDNTWATPSGGVTGSTNQVVRISSSNVGSGSSVFTDDGAATQTYCTACTTAQTVITNGNTANTNGLAFTLNGNTSQSGNPFVYNNQFGVGFAISPLGAINAAHSFTNIGGVTPTDQQVPTIAYSTHLTAQTGAITTTNTVATATAGDYMVCAKMQITTAGSAGTFQYTLGFNDGAAQTIVGSTLLTTTNNAYTNTACQTVTVTAAALTYAVAAAGVTGTPQYRLDVQWIRMN